jgi:phage tail sheath protein FI
MTYKHGVFGLQVPTIDTLPPSGVGTLPVYVGTAPIQQLSDYSNSINMPIMINSFEDAKAKIGYSDDWNTFTLCEAVYAHFKNSISPIGPIVVINVLDPAIHKIAAAPASVVITNGVGYINDNVAVLSSVAITGKVNGTDYTVEYISDGRVKIKQITTLVSPSTVNYNKIDKTKVTNAEIIGAKDANEKRTGITCLELVYQMFNMIPTILAAPGWSHIPAIKVELVSKARKLNGHWDLEVVADLECTTTKTIAAAKAWKDTNLYNDVNLKICWPKAKAGDKVYWLSTMTVVRMQQTDFNNKNVPYESPSNKQLGITGAILGDGTVINMDELQANDLNSKGITTINFRGGIWVLWGPHNANYEYGTTVDPKNVFDASIRMMMYLTNSFQENYLADTDGPLNRSRVQTILNDSQTWLNSLISDGKMLYGNIAFNETSNPLSSVVEGDFVFDTQVTTTPTAKSLTFSVQYTTQGINTLFGGDN